MKKKILNKNLKNFSIKYNLIMIYIHISTNFTNLEKILII